MEGFEKQINRLMDLTAYQVSRMKEQPEKFYFIFDAHPGMCICFDFQKWKSPDFDNILQQ